MGVGRWRVMWGVVGEEFEGGQIYVGLLIMLEIKLMGYYVKNELE